MHPCLGARETSPSHFSLDSGSLVQRNGAAPARLVGAAHPPQTVASRTSPAAAVVWAAQIKLLFVFFFLVFHIDGHLEPNSVAWRMLVLSALELGHAKGLFGSWHKRGGQRDPVFSRRAGWMVSG